MDTVEHEDLWKSQQSWHYQSLFGIGDHKCKVRIEKNFYNNQSSAKLSHWYDGEWREVIYLPFYQWPKALQVLSSTSRKAEIEPFREGQAILVKRAGFVLT